MHVSRIGLAALKGTRHTDLTSVELTADGPVGDRVLCLVDPTGGRVVRTVENPSLLRVTVSWRDGVLTARLPGGTASGVPVRTGRRLEVDYWGRCAALEEVEGPWAAAFSRHLGHEVLLARAAPGEVVYGGVVSLVTTSSLELLAERTGAPVQDASFRATFTVDTAGLPPHVEDEWPGRRLRLGEAEVAVRGSLPRCAVIDLDPRTGERGTTALRCLGGYRRRGAEVAFGLHAVVTRPGRVARGDRCGLGESGAPRATGAAALPATAGRG